MSTDGIDLSLNFLYITIYLELELFTDIAEPPTLLPCLEKLLDAKKRLATTNKLMAKTNERVERIQKELLEIKKD